MIGGTLSGDREVIAKFSQRSVALGREVETATKRLAVRLQTKVKVNYLSGQVLGVRTGRGRRSIHEETFREGGKVVGVVSTNLFYMVGWETGWQGATPRASLAQAKAKFSPKASATRFANGSAKQRAFLLPALGAMKSSGEILDEYRAAAERAMQ